jgi:hypothetical protein
MIYAALGVEQDKHNISEVITMNCVIDSIAR